MKKAKLIKLKFKEILNCFFPKKGLEYIYLGYAFWSPESKEYPYILDFYKAVDKVARPWWCPKFILRLTYLLGNDNSIVRVRNRKISDIHTKITKGIMITDLKWKYESFRIYGRFTDELYELANKTCNLIEKNCYESL